MQRLWLLCLSNWLRIINIPTPERLGSEQTSLHEELNQLNSSLLKV